MFDRKTRVSIIGPIIFAINIWASFSWKSWYRLVSENFYHSNKKKRMMNCPVRAVVRFVAHLSIRSRSCIHKTRFFIQRMIQFFWALDTLKFCLSRVTCDIPYSNRKCPMHWSDTSFLKISILLKASISSNLEISKSNLSLDIRSILCSYKKSVYQQHNRVISRRWHKLNPGPLRLKRRIFAWSGA